MTIETALPAALMIAVALFLTAAHSANLGPGEPLWPTADEKSDFTLGLIACALSFTAGWLL